jgi:hypothetical protein
VADGDGTLSRVDTSSTVATVTWVGGSLERVAAGAGRVWATTAALDQSLPGGAG